jgi:hypothetical protein
MLVLRCWGLRDVLKLLRKRALFAAVGSAVFLAGCGGVATGVDGGSSGGGGGGCNSNYSGCLDANASDYDCTGGSGNGPMYTGSVSVIGYDEYGLDRDGDGTGCD